MARKGFFDLSDCQWAPSDVNRVMLRELYHMGLSPVRKRLVPATADSHMFIM